MPLQQRDRFRFGLPMVGLGMLAAAACNSADSGQGGTGSILPADVHAIVFLQRVPRDSNGNVFDYASYVAGGRIMKLEPPSPSGKLTDLTALAAQTAMAADPQSQVSF